MPTGTVYTETVIYAAAEEFAAEVPFQTAIVEMDNGGRMTGRILGERVQISDRVGQVDSREGVPYFEKIP
ncbi:MAG: OB-fold domain-containing protein [Bryobacteraceae bacterium]